MSRGARASIVTVVLTLAVGGWYCTIRAAHAAQTMAAELTKAGELSELAPRPQATLVYDRAGRPVFSFFVEQRVDVPLSAVSPRMIEAVIAIEDRRFYSHNGIDPVRVAGAAVANARAGRIVQGGSTITQQLARVSQLTPSRTYWRKLREVMLASRLEERYSKDKILEQYLNTVYFGEGFYGVEAAARGYFGKAASDLDVHEAALLAGLVRSPSSDAPCRAPDRALRRRNLVLRLMKQQDLITEAELQHSLGQPLPDRTHRRHALGAVLAASSPASGLYFQEEIRRQLVQLFGDDRVLRGGLRVYSTYDPALQYAAEQTVARRIERLTKGRPRIRDLQGSLVAMDPQTGDVLALVGGRDFTTSRFNRATQARRQAGSAFKPIIYAAALERGYAPGTLLRELDAPIVSASGAWLPAGEHERTEYTLRHALRVSSNRAAAQLLQHVGVSTAVYYAHRLGIVSEQPMVPSLALGTGEVTLLELTAAYTAFANEGTAVAPRLITRVDDSSGTTLWHAPDRQTRAISPTTAYLMSSMLSDVVSRGTGTAARAAGFKLPAAGKTGTTDDFADAWFIGYTPHVVAGVWFGMDRRVPIMTDGFAGVVAAPAWGEFMRVATRDHKPDWYRMPADVEKVAMCRLSGARATDACRRDASAMTQPYTTATDPLYQTVDAAYPAPVQPLPPPRPAQPGVYEDLFPIGAVPIDFCMMHGEGGYGPSIGLPANGEAVPTPLVDAALERQSSAPPTLTPVGTTGVSVPPSTVIRSAPGTRIVVERVVGPDGVVRYVMKSTR